MYHHGAVFVMVVSCAVVKDPHHRYQKWTQHDYNCQKTVKEWCSRYYYYTLQSAFDFSSSPKHLLRPPHAS